MKNNLKKAMCLLLCMLVAVSVIACSQPEAVIDNALGQAIGQFREAASYKSTFVWTINADTEKYPETPSGDNITYVKYIKEPFQMLYHQKLIDHDFYDLILQDGDNVLRHSRKDDQIEVLKVEREAIEGNLKFYSFVIDLIEENIASFVEENAQSIPGKTSFKGELLPEQVESLYKSLESQYLSVENGIPLLGLYRNIYKCMAASSRPAPVTIVIDDESIQIMKITVDTTMAMKEAELKDGSQEINEENMKNTLILESSLTQEFSNCNQLQSIRIP